KCACFGKEIGRYFEGMRWNMVEIDVSIIKRSVDMIRELGGSYGDIRIESYVGEGVTAENGEIKNVYRQSGMGLGVRAIAKGSWGFASADISDISELKRKLKETVKNAINLAKATSKHGKVELADIKPIVREIRGRCKKRPITIEEKKELVINMTKTMKEVETIVMGICSLYHTNMRKCFYSTDGSEITEDLFFVGGYVYANGVANGMQSYLKPFGAKGGWEFIDAIDPVNTAKDVAVTVKKLVTEAVTPKIRETKVVTTPEFNTLKVHEIVGHPVEADRVLGGESAWAGRAWWKDLVGKSVASELVTVVSDARPIPKHEGCFGTFHYDDEGVPSSRVVHIENGILSEFLHSRQTAEIFGVVPNGGMRATSATMVPIIRMTNTYFEPVADGPRSLEEAIEDIDDGVILGQQSIPSIDSRRYRWQISAYEGWEIKNGEIKKMLKNIALIGNTPEYLKSIYRVGASKTFKLFPIPNCGKGDPMQVQRVCNGGPIMVGIGKIIGGI
ncbi:MAG: TldD/PmbA family protein, partial [Candidatus Thermoplasmatota archaeon]